MKTKSQSSLEFMLIFGIGFFLIIIMAGIFFTFSSEATQNLDKKQLNKISNDIMTNVENVYFSGNGNRITEDVNLPDGIENITIHRVNQSGQSYDYLNLSYYFNEKLVSEIVVPKQTYIKFKCSSCDKVNQNISYFSELDISSGPKRIRFESKGDYVEINFVKDEIIIPEVFLFSNVTNVDIGDSINLSWEALNSQNCIATGDWSGNKGVKGNEIITGLTINSSFTLSCDDGKYTSYKTLNINVDIPSIEYVSTGTRYNVNIFEDLGSPATIGIYTWINDGKIGSTSSTEASVTTGNFPEGSSLLIINNGQIYGAGGNGIWTNQQAANDGGTALNIEFDNTEINNTKTGNIFGGGGSGGSGYWVVCSGGHQLSMPGGAGQGLVGGSNSYVTDSANCGPVYGNFKASLTSAGSETGPGPQSNKYTRDGVGGTLNCNSKGCGGEGGTWGSSGSYGTWTGWGDNSPSNLDPGGAGGNSVKLNGNSVVWLEGNNANQVKGVIN